MSNFLDAYLNQRVFFDINYLEVLGNNTFEYCLYHLLEGNKIVSDFYACYRVYISNRIIERSCKTDLKFIALAAGRQPQFTMIANFFSSNCEAMERYMKNSEIGSWA